MDTREQYENIRKELKQLKEELFNLNVHCNERLTKIETLNNNLETINNNYNALKEYTKISM